MHHESRPVSLVNEEKPSCTARESCIVPIQAEISRIEFGANGLESRRRSKYHIEIGSISSDLSLTAPEDRDFSIGNLIHDSLTNIKSHVTINSDKRSRGGVGGSGLSFGYFVDFSRPLNLNHESCASVDRVVGHWRGLDGDGRLHHGRCTRATRVGRVGDGSRVRRFTRTWIFRDCDDLTQDEHSWEDQHGKEPRGDAI